MTDPAKAADLARQAAEITTDIEEDAAVLRSMPTTALASLTTAVAQLAQAVALLAQALLGSEESP